MISRIKALAPAIQDGGAALLLDGHVELVARAGADGAHLTGIAAHGGGAAVAETRPHRRRRRTDDPARFDGRGRSRRGLRAVRRTGRDGASGLRSEAIAERLQWWAELFEPPCVGFAASREEASEFAAAGADFVLVGDFIWADPRGAAAALIDVEQAIQASARRGCAGKAKAEQG